MREPHMMKSPTDRRLTLLDCQVGNHTGHFAITKTPRGWACPEHQTAPSITANERNG